jgi:hypothetical protein
MTLFLVHIWRTWIWQITLPLRVPKYPEDCSISHSKLRRIRKRLEDMFVFKIAFENGRRSRGVIPDEALIPAHMAY